ncbi:MAG: RIP metalloprotease RseP [Chthoniobacterales bacterium]
MFLHALRIIFILLEVIVLFNLLIVVHEVGHFLAARWRGLVIEKFGVWFGKPLWKKTFNGVEYSLGSIPLGGFVALPQLAPMDMIEGETDADRATLPRISVLDKIIVAVAGPVFSLLLALVFATLVWGVGHPVGEADTTTIIGYVEPGSPGEKAGLKAGDKILEVDGKRVTRFSGMSDSVTWNVIRSEGDRIPFVVDRGGQRLSLSVVPYIAPTSGWRRKSVRQVLIYPASKPIIDEVEAGSPAAAAGLQPGDIIEGFNRHPMYNAIALADFIRQHPKDKLTLDVLRGDRRLETALSPVPLMTKGKMVPRIGIAWDTTGKMTISHPNPVEQVYDSITSTLNTIEAVASPKSDVKLQHLSGPVGIVRIYYLLFESDRGWQLALWFSVILNVNLAILNLLPIPVLDGGHIVLALVEAVRRKPVNIRVLEIVQTGCAVLIIGYIAYVSFFDVGDWLGEKRGAAPAADVQASPTP